MEETRRRRFREGERDDHGPKRQELVDGQARRGRASVGAWGGDALQTGFLIVEVHFAKDGGDP